MGKRTFEGELHLRQKGAAGFFVRHEHIFEVLFVLICLLFYLMWMMAQGENYAPDELMRYMIPRYIFRHGTLPTGWEQEVLERQWGISYGFKPTQLPAILSALCMKLVSFFNSTDRALLLGARIPSVLCGAGGVFVLFRIMGRLFSRPVKWLVVVLTATIPQYIFLSSYVNNDIVAAFGTFLILWAWVAAAQDGWCVRNGILLSVGIAVVGLSYFNAFGWILMSVFYFFLTQDYPGREDSPWEKKEKRKRIFRVLLVICCVSLALALPLYLRNLFIHGDLLGDAAVAASQAQRADPEFLASLPLTPKAQGLSILDLLSYENFFWPQTTLRSFFGYFGFMTYPLTTKYYVLYYILFGGGLFAMLLSLGYAGRGKEPVLEESGIRGRKTAALLLCVLASILITVGLYTWYAYASDFQAQGRYVYPALVGILLFLGIGFTFIRRHPRILWFMIFVGLVANVLCVFFDNFLTTTGM